MSALDTKMCRMLTIVLLVVLLVGVSPSEEDSTKNVFGQCILPLGMEEGRIPDNAITASSSYETKSVGPQNARIRQEKNGGAWCPKAQISSAIREYLEIDLTRNHLISWTETQGRFGNGQGQEYAEAFFLEYWRDTKWHQYRNLKGDRVRVVGKEIRSRPHCFEMIAVIVVDVTVARRCRNILMGNVCSCIT